MPGRAPQRASGATDAVHGLRSLGHALTTGVAATLISLTAAGAPARLEFVDPDLQPVAAQNLAAAERWRAAYPRAAFPGTAVWLAFGIAPGRPAGPSEVRPYLRLLLAREPPLLERRYQGDFEVDLERAERELAAAAAPLAHRPEDDGLAATPADCRIARLQLGLYDSLHYPMAATVGLVDSAEQVALLYTDRPCRISGAIDLQRSATFVDLDPALRARFAGRYEHDIDLPGAGLHWMRIQRDGPGSFSVRRTDAPSGMLRVFALLPGVTLEPAPASMEKP